MSRSTSVSDQVINKLDVLKPKIIELDNRRWQGEEWQRGDMPEAKAIFFDNVMNLPAETRLTAMWYWSLLDRRVAYEKVWHDGLNQVLDYLRGSDRIPQVRFSEHHHFEASARAFGNNPDGFFSWMLRKVLTEQSPDSGNLYRLVGSMAEELLGSHGPEVERLRGGKPGLLGNWKRLWMFVMVLRRDGSFIRRLVEEAGDEKQSRSDLVNRWYGDKFPEKESELPVDSRIRNFFVRLGAPKSSSLATIAGIAHEWGKKNNLAPSLLDVAFVPRFNDELLQYGRERGLSWEAWWERR